MTDVLIIGGGASGLMAAITVAKLGASTCILEQNEKLGKKLYATGNGKCNFTNLMQEKECYHGDADLQNLLFERFTYKDTLAFFEGIGVAYKDKNGYVYPCSEQASVVVSKLSEEAKRSGVQLLCGYKVTGVNPTSEGYAVITQDGKQMHARTVIVACGLKASPKLGSDGSLLPILEDMGYELEPVVPALCGFYCKGAKFKDMAGVRVQGTVELYVDDCLVQKDTGEIQLTEYGISGIPVFQVSSWASKALAKGQRVEAILRFLPQLTQDEILEYMNSYLTHTAGECTYEQLITSLLPDKLCYELLRRCGIGQNENVNRMLLDKLVAEIKSFKVKITRSRDYEFAQVCAGGIGTSYIHKDTLESKTNPGLFFCGELCDIDGICGGYNLQWAWTSGYVAGEESVRYLRNI